MKKIPFGPLRSAHVSFNVGSAGHANCQYSWLVGVNLQSLVGQIAPVGNESTVCELCQSEILGFHN